MSRWKTAVRASLATLYSGMQLLRRRQAGFRVLMYHSVGPTSPGDHYGHSVEVADFKRQLGYLRERFDVVAFTRESLTSLNHERNCCITFDDGFADNLTAAELLVAHGMPFTVFVTSEFVGKPGYLSLFQLRELGKLAHCQIGAHGASHSHLGWMPIDQQRRELEDSKKALQDWLGRDVNSMSYPHGSFNAASAFLAQAAGFEISASSRPGFNGIAGLDWYHVRRTEIRGEEGWSGFEARMSGRYDFLDLIYTVKSLALGSHNSQWVRAGIAGEL